MILRLKNRRVWINIAKRDVLTTIYFIIENDKIVGIIDMWHLINQDYFKKFDTPLNKQGQPPIQDIRYLGALNTYYKWYICLNVLSLRWWSNR